MPISNDHQLFGILFSICTFPRYKILAISFIIIFVENNFLVPNYIF